MITNVLSFKKDTVLNIYSRIDIYTLFNIHRSKYNYSKLKDAFFLIRFE